VDGPFPYEQSRNAQLGAELETETRFPTHEDEPPESYRWKQVSVALAIGLVVVGFVFYLTMR